MKSEQKKNKLELFFPYYINQSRLLDIYAILNSGYTEYSEISTSISVEKTKTAKGDINMSGGFKLLNIGGDFSGEIGKSDGTSSENKEKKVQTVTSILSIVKDTLSEKGYLSDIEGSKAGRFVMLPVVLKINSMKSLLDEMSDLMSFIKNISDKGIAANSYPEDIKKIEATNKLLKVLFSGEEVFYETNDYAIIGNIINDNLYQSSRADLIGTNLHCLAQVKRVFPHGTELMKNTVFAKIKDTGMKERFINGLKQLTEGEFYEYEATAIASVKTKPVYELEIIALYQINEAN